ncbi:GNAT family N-acetyltransferase [Aliikangiella sp. IMCC44359]|uniref:GNAT family N-acetyltransferase n=1 Tax=Aliikangiella sp. IMCC44359 TaxID=3459125 RepID=UPI00403AD1F6
MNYQLKYPELAEALYLALLDDAFYQTMEASVDGDDNVKKQAMLAYMDCSIIESQNFGECFIPEKQHYGVSVWAKPISQDQTNEKNKMKETFIRQYMGDNSYSVYQDICQAMQKNSHSLVLDSDWYLSIIGILPEFQGQGLGPGLVQSILNKTDKLNIGTFLETFTKRNMTFYFRLGYEVLGEFMEPNTNATYWLMRRQPKPEK